MLKPRNIEEEIILSLYKIFRYARKQYTEGDHHEPSAAQLQAMQAIKQGKTTTGEIADELHVAFPTATVMLDRLVDAGFVMRQLDENDRRIIRLSLTGVGNKTLKQSFSKKMKKAKQLLDMLPPEDKKDLHRILQNLYNTLEKEDMHGK